MKISAIAASNFCGIRHVDIGITKPVLFLTSFNGAGKSSLLDGIKLAVTSVPSRVTLKRDYGEMIKDGAKAGKVSVVIDGDNCFYDLAKKSGQSFNVDDMPALPYVLDASLFNKASLSERRNILFAITGRTATPELIVKRLLERGCDSGKVEAIKPILKAGFEAAHKEAKGKTTESRGAWKGVTGETYGDEKSSNWIAPRPEAFDADELAKQEAAFKLIESQHDANAQQLGALEQQWREADANKNKLDDLRQNAAMLERLTMKLEVDEAELLRLQALIASVNAMTCPCCNERLVIKGGELVKVGLIGLAKHIPEYIESRDMVIRAIANDKKGIADAQAAKSELSKLGAAPDLTLMLENIEALRVRLNAIKADRQKAHVALNKLMLDEQALAQANTKTSQAATYHADAQAWSKIAEALAPEGIQTELLVDVLKVVNSRLRQSADDTGWKQAAIDADMNITADGRIYALLSESEQWRVNVVITEMISHLSGLKLMLIDRMDVLDLPSRGQCLGWLDLLASEGDVDTVVVAATLKELPKRLPPTFQAYWLEGGEAHTETVISAAA